MKEVRISFNIGPSEDNSEISGNYIFMANNPDESFIVNALKKSIARLKIDKEKFIVGLFDVFIDNKQTYEIGVFGIRSIIKTDIKKL